MVDCEFYDGNFWRTELTDLRALKTSFECAGFSELMCFGTSIFTECVFDEANFADANLKGQGFTGSLFRRTDLTYADLSFADFSRCDFTGSIFENSVTAETNFDGALNWRQ